MPIRLSKSLLNGTSSRNNCCGYEINNIQNTGIKSAGEEWVLFNFRKDHESSSQLLLVNFSLRLCLTCTSMYTLDSHVLRSHAKLFATQLQANMETNNKILAKVV